MLLVTLADSLPLALLEILVHLERPRALGRYRFFRVRFEARHLLELAPEDLPDDWRADPEPASTTAIGAAWAERRASLLLRVPSVVVPQNANYLLDPRHPDRDELTIEGPFPFEIDPRL